VVYVVASSKSEARTRFSTGTVVFDTFNEAEHHMNYENNFGYFADIEHFVFEVEQKIKAKKLI
jgi:hypothetical protein